MTKKRCGMQDCNKPAKNWINVPKRIFKENIKIYNLRKKSQISIFLIAGGLLVLLVMYFILISKILTPDPSHMTTQSEQSKIDSQAFEKKVEYCLEKETRILADELGKMGGTLNNTEYQLNSRLFKEKKYRILCSKIPGMKHCVNRMLTAKEMEKEMKFHLKQNIDSCINISSFSELGYTIKTGNKNTSIKIAESGISVSLIYPITLTKHEAENKESREIKLNDFYVEYNHPLGLMHKLVIDIVNEEAGEGRFNKDKWMEDNNLLFSINKEKPYPFVLYTINSTKKNEYTKSNQKKDYSFLFAIKQDSVDILGSKENAIIEYGCCYHGSECFKNVQAKECSDKGGSYDNYPSCSCSSKFAGSLEKKEYADCGEHKDGESWCLNEKGIGGRSIKYSCHDGEIYTEPCEDYHEEICVEFQENNTQKAICKDNRWEDCTRCNNEECCTDHILRDCIWMDKNSSMTPTIVEESDLPRCLPKISPGSRFWEGDKENQCSKATGYAICDSYKCPEEWIDYVASSCSRLRDCGINSNYIGQITKNGYLETDTFYNPIFEEPKYEWISTESESDSIIRDHRETGLSMIPSLITASLRYADNIARKKSSVIDYSFCNTWQAPIDDQKCNNCNTHPFCSEYKCMSLGQDCLYEEDEEGYPECKKSESGESDMKINVEPGQKYTSSEVILNKKTIKGYNLKEAIPINEKIELSIKTSKPSKCKITYMPEKDFSGTPAIWFGSGSFSKYHNASFRLPNKIELPNALYKSLNVSTLDEIFMLIARNDKKISEEFPQEITPLLEKIKIYLDDKEEMISIINLTLSAMENDEYYLFLKCSDSSGNYNIDPIFLNFKINNSIEDKKPPEILYHYPQNKSLVSTPYELSIYVNEPSECKYSSKDINFNAMDNWLRCETSPLQMSSSALGSYECTTNTDLLTPYIRCKDNAPAQKDYALRIVPEKSMSKGDYNITNLNRNLKTRLNTGELHNNTALFLNDSSALYELELNLYSSSKCFAGYNGYDIMKMEKLNCSGDEGEWDNDGIMQCNLQAVSGNYTTYITCIEYDGYDEQKKGKINTKGNINKKSYSLNYFTDSKLSIISVFPPEGEILDPGGIMISTVVNKDILEEEINCGYKIDNNDEFFQMYQIGAYQFRKNIYDIIDGEHDLKIRCFDKSGSIAEKETFFIVD